MKFSITICCILSIIVIANANEEQERQSVPQLPISVLEELFAPENVDNNNGNSGSSGLAELIPGSGSETDSSSNGSSGIPFFDLFRSLIRMIFNTFLQFFKVFNLLSRNLTGNGSNKLLFKSENDADTDKVSAEEGFPVVKQLQENVRLLQSSISELTQKFTQILERDCTPSGSGVPFLDQFGKFLKLWQNQAKIVTNQIRKLLIENNKNRDKRQIMSDQLESLQLPMKTLLRDFYKSLSGLNDKNFEFINY